MYQTGTHGSVGGRLANQSSASYPIVGRIAKISLIGLSKLHKPENEILFTFPNQFEFAVFA